MTVQEDGPHSARPRKGRIKQGLWTTTFGNGAAGATFTFDQMCSHAAQLGVHGFDLVPLDSLPTLEAYGLKLLIAGPGPIDRFTGMVAGLAHPEGFEALEAGLRTQVEACTRYGIPSIALMSGQRRGISLAEAADNAVAFLRRVTGLLESHNVTVCIENVNSRRPGEPALGRDDMVFGHWEWGVDVCERVASPNVKLLCDIYHLQIMDGDVARRIQDSHQWIGHFHVAGVPSRCEIDASQELNFRYIAEVIAGLPYDGYVSHEWTPRPGRDPLETIAQALEIMDA